MPNNFRKENTRMRETNPEQFTKESSHNSLSQVFEAKERIRKQNEKSRFLELEELILETSSLDPKFAEYVSEYNNLDTRLHANN